MGSLFHLRLTELVLKHKNLHVHGAGRRTALVGSFNTSCPFHSPIYFILVGNRKIVTARSLYAGRNIIQKGTLVAYFVFNYLKTHLILFERQSTITFTITKSVSCILTKIYASWGYMHFWFYFGTTY